MNLHDQLANNPTYAELSFDEKTQLYNQLGAGLSQELRGEPVDYVGQNLIRSSKFALGLDTEGSPEWQQHEAYKQRYGEDRFGNIVGEPAGFIPEDKEEVLVDPETGEESIYNPHALYVSAKEGMKKELDPDKFYDRGVINEIIDEPTRLFTAIGTSVGRIGLGAGLGLTKLYANYDEVVLNAGRNTRNVLITAGIFNGDVNEVPEKSYYRSLAESLSKQYDLLLYNDPKINQFVDGILIDTVIAAVTGGAGTAIAASGGPGSSAFAAAVRGSFLRGGGARASEALALQYPTRNIYQQLSRIGKEWAAHTLPAKELFAHGSTGAIGGLVSQLAMEAATANIKDSDELTPAEKAGFVAAWGLTGGALSAFTIEARLLNRFARQAAGIGLNKEALDRNLQYLSGVDLSTGEAAAFSRIMNDPAAPQEVKTFISNRERLFRELPDIDLQKLETVVLEKMPARPDVPTFNPPVPTQPNMLQRIVAQKVEGTAISPQSLNAIDAATDYIVSQGSLLGRSFSADEINAVRRGVIDGWINYAPPSAIGSRATPFPIDLAQGAKLSNIAVSAGAVAKEFPDLAKVLAVSPLTQEAFYRGVLTGSHVLQSMAAIGRTLGPGIPAAQRAEARKVFEQVSELRDRFKFFDLPTGTTSRDVLQNLTLSPEQRQVFSPILQRVEEIFGEIPVNIGAKVNSSDMSLFENISVNTSRAYYIPDTNTASLALSNPQGFIHEIGHHSWYYGLSHADRMRFVNEMVAVADNPNLWQNIFPGYQKTLDGIRNIADPYEQAKAAMWLDDVGEMYAQQFSAAFFSGHIPTPSLMPVVDTSLNQIKRIFNINDLSPQTPAALRDLYYKVALTPESSKFAKVKTEMQPQWSRMLQNADELKSIANSPAFALDETLHADALNVINQKRASSGVNLGKQPLVDINRTLISGIARALDGNNVNFKRLDRIALEQDLYLSNSPSKAIQETIYYRAFAGSGQAFSVPRINIADPKTQELMRNTNSRYAAITPDEYQAALRTQLELDQEIARRSAGVTNERELRVIEDTVLAEVGPSQNDGYRKVREAAASEIRSLREELSGVSDTLDAVKLSKSYDLLDAEKYRARMALNYVSDNAGKFVADTLSPEASFNMSRALAAYGYLYVSGFEPDSSNLSDSTFGSIRWNPEKAFNDSLGLSYILAAGSLGLRGYTNAVWRTGARAFENTAAAQALRTNSSWLRDKYNRYHPREGFDKPTWDLIKEYQADIRRVKRDFSELTNKIVDTFPGEENRQLRRELSLLVEGYTNMVAPERLSQLSAFVDMIRAQYRSTQKQLLAENLISPQLAAEDYFNRVVLRERDLNGKTRPFYQNSQVKKINQEYLFERGQKFSTDSTQVSYGVRNANDASELLTQQLERYDKLVQGTPVNSYIKLQPDGTYERRYHLPNTAEAAEARANGWLRENTPDGKVLDWTLEQVDGRTPVLRRDHFVGERRAHGEEFDAALRISKMGEQTADDIARSKFYRSISESRSSTLEEAFSQRGLDPSSLTKTQRDEQLKAWGLTQIPLDKNKVGGYAFGQLAGRYVDSETLRAVNYIADGFKGWNPNGPLGKAYRAGVSEWKINKTALNYQTHINNVTSNTIAAYISGENPITIVRDGIPLMRARSDLKRARTLRQNGDIAGAEALEQQVKSRKANQYLREAEEYGMLDSHFLSDDYNHIDDIENLLNQKAKEAPPTDNFAAFELTSATMIDAMRRAATGVTGGIAGAGVGGIAGAALTGDIGGVIGAGLGAVGGASFLGKIRKPVLALYEAEDMIFKLGYYSQLRERGLSPAEASQRAYQVFFDYSDLPSGIKSIRDRGIVPFISYQYKAIPMVANAVLDHPERVASLAAVMYGLSYASAAQEYDDARAGLKYERMLMPSHLKESWLGIPTALRLPTLFGANEKNSQRRATYLNTTRYLPLGDMFSMDDEGRPGSVFGGPIEYFAKQNPLLGMAWTFAGGRQPGQNYTQWRDFHDLSGSQQQINTFADQMKYVWNVAAPNNFFIPGTYSFDRVVNNLVSNGLIDKNGGLNNIAAMWGGGYTGEDNYSAIDVTDTASVITNTLGIKTANLYPDRAFVKNVQAWSFNIREDLKFTQQQARRYANGQITQQALRQALNVPRESAQNFKRRVTQLQDARHKAGGIRN